MWGTVIISSKILTLRFILPISFLEKSVCNIFPVNLVLTYLQKAYMVTLLFRNQLLSFADIFFKFYWLLTACQNSKLKCKKTFRTLNDRPTFFWKNDSNHTVSQRRAQGLHLYQKILQHRFFAMIFANILRTL